MTVAATPEPANADDMLRILVVSHGHPTLSFGGAEIASYNLHLGLKASPQAQSFFLARVDGQYPGHSRSALMGAGEADDELLYHADDYDPFLISNRNTNDLLRDFRRFVRTLNPDVIHFHHFIGLGLEALYVAREAVPNAAIFVTFHEFLPMCHHHGQMVKTSGHRLCEKASPISCHGCFPEIDPGQFLRRKQFVQSMLALADGYISPSHFLAERYIRWGIPAEKFVVIENGLNVPERADIRKPAGANARRSKFAYFGQMTPYKGIDVLLDAVQRVPEAVWGDDATLTIFGGNLERQPEAFRNKVSDLLEKTEDRVRFAGAYENKDMPTLMRQVDWVMMPSVWWENSPVIIQEAFFHGRPLICSGIGGMAEKVRDNVDGLHVLAGSPEDLSAKMVEVLETPSIWTRLHSGIQQPKSHIASAGEHLGYYRLVIELRQADQTALTGGLQKSA
ncbi:MAG: glycosyltransferase family 4 protein [Roseibium sp.]|uniref:glycosyltransferase family 4 protein n=1 Tax=Roseibium sp. TaxID=1936156 RepID=UPI002611FAF4|nr:glycosyltransferase family 4 protein [Roseibium sp.]MCV0425184.1 glycosyltransferase family 4 protein [Roseibium sp.]